MNRSLLGGLVAGVVAAAALAAPAQAGHRSHHGHRAHHVHVIHHKVHVFHAYRHVHYTPVCLKHEWVYSYGHKKWACVIWK